MAMNYEELDDQTRKYMLAAFQEEETSGKPYRSAALSAAGLAVFSGLMENAIKSGTETSLYQALGDARYWTETEEYTRAGVTRTRHRNIPQSAQRLALTEFSTWYVKGFAKRLLAEGIDKCRVYRGEEPKWAPDECARHEGMICSVQDIHDKHRARYWPEPGDKKAFSIPSGPGCHHIIGRVP
jgi:hypothetical protein